MKTMIDKDGWVIRVSEELAPRMINKGYEYCPKSKWKALPKETQEPAYAKSSHTNYSLYVPYRK